MHCKLNIALPSLNSESVFPWFILSNFFFCLMIPNCLIMKDVFETSHEFTFLYDQI